MEEQRGGTGSSRATVGEVLWDSTVGLAPLTQMSVMHKPVPPHTPSPTALPLVLRTSCSGRRWCVLNYILGYISHFHERFNVHGRYPRPPFPSSPLPLPPFSSSISILFPLHLCHGHMSNFVCHTLEGTGQGLEARRLKALSSP